MSRLKLCYYIFLIFLCSGLANAQRTGTYLFNGTLEEKDSLLPPLTVLGGEGSFVEEKLIELGNDSRTVYRFNKNSGLRFDNLAAENFFKRSYTIEMYFKVDKLLKWIRVIDYKNRKTDTGCYILNGKLNFHKIASSDYSPVRAGEYTHYVVTRDSASNRVCIYTDGESKIEFEDVADLAVVDDDNFIQFFYDDLIYLNETSSGSMALMRVSDFAFTPGQVKASYDNLRNDVFNGNASTPVRKFKVRLIDEDTQFALDGEIELKDEKGKVIWRRKTTKGTLTDSITSDNLSFKLQASASGYHVVGEKVVFEPNDYEYSVIYTMRPFKLGEKIRLNNIHFLRSHYDLLPESYDELDKLVSMMKKNKDMRIELHGHTDNTGSEELNVELSENRVQSVKQYLIDHGVKKNRTSGKGFGGAIPIASNEQEETRKLNRRVEFIITRF